MELINMAVIKKRQHNQQRITVLFTLRYNGPQRAVFHLPGHILFF